MPTPQSRKTEKYYIDSGALARLLELKGLDLTQSEIAAQMNLEGYRLFNGQEWHQVAVHRWLHRSKELGDALQASNEADRKADLNDFEREAVMDRLVQEYRAATAFPFPIDSY